MPLTLLAIGFALLLGREPPSSPGAFVLEVEPNHSTIGFSVPIVHGMTRITGKFTDFSVTIRFEEANLARCSVEASIKAASVNTGIEERDVHLRGPLFFAARDHPLITFKSSRIEKRTDDYALHGTTAITWEDGKPRLGVAAQLSLDRLDYRVGNDWKHTGIPDFLGSEIAVEIFLWTKLGRPAAGQE